MTSTRSTDRRPLFRRSPAASSSDRTSSCPAEYEPTDWGSSPYAEITTADPSRTLNRNRRGKPLRIAFAARFVNSVSYTGTMARSGVGGVTTARIPEHRFLLPLQGWVATRSKWAKRRAAAYLFWTRFPASTKTPVMVAPNGERPTGRSLDSGSSGETGENSTLDGEGMRTETLGAAGRPRSGHTPLVVRGLV